MKDIKCPAVVVSKRGRVPDTIQEGERITVPTFEIASYPQVRFSQVKARRFNLIDRAWNKMLGLFNGNIKAKILLYAGTPLE